MVEKTLLTPNEVATLLEFMEECEAYIEADDGCLDARFVDKFYAAAEALEYEITLY